MISFKELNEDNAREVLAYVKERAPEADTEYAEEIIGAFVNLAEEGDRGFGITVAAGCLLARVFDMGRYSFVYPIALCEESDEAVAADEIRAYAVKEELPLVFTDVPAECVGELICGFRHAQADAADPERDSYTVEILNELMLSDGECGVVHGELTLSPLCEEDTAEYAALCRDGEVNKYWGYRYESDCECPADGYFLSEALGEYNRGIALSLAVRLGEVLIGEAVLHAFDYKGGAELGFRLATKWQGKGFGRRTLEAAVGIARKIGLVRLGMRVMNENEVSKHLLSSYAEGKVCDGITYYEIEL